MKAYGQVKGRNFGGGQRIVPKKGGSGCGPSLREQHEEQQRRAALRKADEGRGRIG